MSEVESCIVVENGEANNISNGDINLNVSVESQDSSNNVEVNGVHENGLNKEPTLVPLKDKSGSVSPRASRTRKSSMERLLEEQHNTSEEQDNVFSERNGSFSSQGSFDSDCSNKSKPRRTSIYEQKHIKAPVIPRGNIISSRTENLFKNYERDMTSHEARPMININEDNIDISQINTDEGQSDIDKIRAEKEKELLEIRKQYNQRIVDEERERAAARKIKVEEKYNTVTYEEDGDVFIERSTSSPSNSSRASISSTASIDEDGSGPTRQRRTSVYEQKQIQAPSSMRGNVIASRTENLMKQYERDLQTEERKPVIDLTEGAEASEEEARKPEVQSIRMQYQRSLQEDVNGRRSSENEIKSRKSLGSQMNRYIALTKGEAVQHSSDEEDDEKDGAVDESLYTDQQGVKIERSGGKIEIVKSSEGISNLKNRFGGKSQWKKTDAVETSSEVDSTNVKSAFSVFKSQENKKEEQPQRNRPKSKKVRDPKELMELRKKATYGNEEELPQDGVIKKSVDVDQEALDTTIKHHALNVYKNLEKREDTLGPVNKPKTKLLSDVEAQATLEGIRSISSSTSEASDVNETVNDLTVDTVSGYGSAAPCSPSSVLSEDYLSDHKDETNRNELKDAALNIEVEAKLTINNTDDVTLIKCQEEITTVEVPAEAPVELVGV